VNMNKCKVTISWESHKVVQHAGRCLW